MGQARIEHVYGCDEEAFWNRIVWNYDFNRSLYLEHLGFERWEEVERTDGDDENRRAVEVVPPKPDLPAVLAKLVKGGLGYRQEDVLDKRAGVMRSRITTHSSDKIHIRGETRTEPASDGKIRRIFTVDVDVKIFGVSGIAEKRVLDEMRKGYDAGAKYANEWLEK